MKTILLMRHAKAEHGGDKRDFDRSLTSRGKDDAVRMGRAIAKLASVPDVIVSSPAARARETAEGAAKGMSFAGAVDFERTLYDAPGEAWLEILKRLPGSADAALVIAHSPGIAEAAALLCGTSPGTFDVPTAGLISLVDDADKWRDLAAGSAVLRWFLRPKLVEHLQD